MQSKSRSEKIPLLVFIFTITLFVMGILYVSWRAFFTLNTLESPLTTFWAYMLLLAELVTLIVFTNFTLVLVKSIDLKKVEPDNKFQNDYYKDVYNEKGELLTFKNFCPSVDIFICTLSESAELLSTTILGCLNIDYPNKKVYILDDGRREKIKELAEKLGCNYITRTTNKGYKAGNINNALEHTNGEIVVIFDADHIPASTFLRETVYNFIDENVALVQTPQHFCNRDAFQKNMSMGKILSNEQDIFYRLIEPGLNEYGSVFCGGTNILIRRTHLNSVGNFPETTITEDSLLGLKFHSVGYKIVYYNRPIAIGLAASEFEEYIKQRCRWAKGNIQIITNPKNWRYYKKLTPIQAFFFISSAFYFITPIARIIFLFAPVLFLFFDISAVIVLFYQIFAFQVCYFSLKFSFIFSNCVRFKNIIFADVYDLVTSVFTIGSILQTLFIPKSLVKGGFFVTQKDGDGKTQNKNTKYIATMAVIFTILLAAQFQGIYDLLYSEVYSKLAIVANLFWNSINLFVAGLAIQVVDEKPEKRRYQRVKALGTAVLNDDANNKFYAEVGDISRSGIKLEMDINNPSVPVEKELKVKLGSEEEEEVELVDCNEEEGKFVCKSFFKNPIELPNLDKIKIKRLDKYVKFTYKKPDKWDEYFKSEEQ